MRNIYNWYISFFALVFALLTLEPMVLLSKAETLYMVSPLARFLGLCFVISITCLLVASKISRIVFLATLSALLTITIVCLKASYHPIFSSLAIELFLFFSFLTFAFLYRLASYFFKAAKKPNLSVFFWVTIVGLSSPAFIYIESSFTSNKVDSHTPNTLILNDKPNIYLLSYDSFIPQSIAREYLSINTVPYQNILNDHFNEFPSSLSFHVPSRPSINDVMRLGQKRSQLNFLSFSGNAPSLLSSILSDNGYKLITGYKGLYFGSGGPFIDQSLFPLSAQIEASVLCIAQRKLERVQAFLICDVARHLSKNYKDNLYKFLFGSELGKIQKNWHDIVLKQFRLNSQNKVPVLTYLYTYNPIGHTSLTYDHNISDQRTDYQAYFQKNAETLSKQISELSNQIKKYDPTSVVIIFGDHGAYLSRSSKIEDNPEFFIKDRHRIVIAMAKTNHRCSKPENLKTEQNFQTPSRLLASVFLCLSDKDQKPAPEFEFDEDPKILKYALAPFSK